MCKELLLLSCTNIWNTSTESFQSFDVEIPSLAVGSQPGRLGLTRSCSIKLSWGVLSRRLVSSDTSTYCFDHVVMWLQFSLALYLVL